MPKNVGNAATIANINGELVLNENFYFINVFLVNFGL